MIVIPPDAECLVFVHSPSQRAIFNRVSRAGWYSIGMRGQRGTLATRDDFALGNVEFVLDFLRALSIFQTRVSVLVPHSDRPNLLFPCLLIADNVSGLGYIEDGWDTWKFLRENDSPCPPDADRTKPLARLFLKSLQVSLSGIRNGRYGRLPKLFVRLLLGISSRYNFFGPYHIPRSFLGFFLTFPWRCARYVDIAPEKLEVGHQRNSPLLFLNPRYLVSPEEFVSSLVGLSRGRSITLQLHPGFWRTRMLARLETFERVMKSQGLRYSFFECKHSEQDIVFDAYQQGYREFWSADSTIELTSFNYKSLLPGLKVVSLSRLVEGKEGYLSRNLGYFEEKIEY